MGAAFSDIFYQILIDDYSAPAGCSGVQDVFGTAADIEDFVTCNRQIQQERYRHQLDITEPKISMAFDALKEAKLKGDEEDIENRRRALSWIVNDYDQEMQRYFTAASAYFDAWEKFRNGDMFVSCHSHYAARPRFVEMCRVIGEKEMMLDYDEQQVKNAYMYDYAVGWRKARIKVKWVIFNANVMGKSDPDRPFGEPERETFYVRCVMYDLMSPKIENVLDSIDDEREFWGMPGLIEYEKDEDWLRSRLYLSDKTFETLDQLEDDMRNFKQPDFRPLLLAVVGDG